MPLPDASTHLDDLADARFALQGFVERVRDDIARMAVASSQPGGEAVAQELAQAQPARWLALAQTQLQEGLMSIERAITMPTHF
jgi:hypothetical protein